MKDNYKNFQEHSGENLIYFPQTREDLNVEFSPFKKAASIYFNESPLKMMKNA